MLDTCVSVLDTLFTLLSVVDTLARVLHTRAGVLDTRTWQVGELRRVQLCGCGWSLGRLRVLDTLVSVLDTLVSVLDTPETLTDVVDTLVSLLDTLLSVFGTRWTHERGNLATPAGAWRGTPLDTAARLSLVVGASGSVEHAC